MQKTRFRVRVSTESRVRFASHAIPVTIKPVNVVPNYIDRTIDIRTVKVVVDDWHAYPDIVGIAFGFQKLLHALAVHLLLVLLLKVVIVRAFLYIVD